MENRNRLFADVEVPQANGTATRDASLIMIEGDSCFSDFTNRPRPWAALCANK